MRVLPAGIGPRSWSSFCLSVSVCSSFYMLLLPRSHAPHLWGPGLPRPGLTCGGWRPRSGRSPCPRGCARRRTAAGSRTGLPSRAARRPAGSWRPPRGPRNGKRNCHNGASAKTGEVEGGKRSRTSVMPKRQNGKTAKRQNGKTERKSILRKKLEK